MATPIKNNLPPASQQWVRDIEQRMADLERENRLLQITANKNATQIAATQAGVAALNLSTDIKTFNGSGTTTFPMFGSGASPFSFNYVVPSGYTKVSFVWSFRGERTGTLAAVDPKWDTIVFINGNPGSSGYSSFGNSSSFTGSYTGTESVQEGDAISFDTYCYMVDSGSQSMFWQTSGIIFAHN